MRMDDRELMKVWKERSAYEPGQIVTDDKIDHIEKAIGFRLPHIYKQLMKLQNGGEMVIPIYPDDELPFVIQYLQELELDKGVGLSTIFVEELHLPKDLVLITGDMYNWLALDYRVEFKEEPSVVFLYEGEDSNWKEILVAETFEELITDLLLEIKS
ncbi:SMI1/KNR4 family protein [Alkalihalobacillus pseudalcaliphilus]|uniref:SMI1/KNR4 family protein n=1 Tax=Alkalihalobacillus pseudalcaliphilus TaxID=79884 RepID=UPI00064DE074|nr:SMI1/KNR4 family protein [Alkalihalobacillus pseudalcaliphilus]KMK76131.1 hypothetical protein AB990_12970 [Alkalihalobacillus pseudalcaliphilus]